MVPQPITEIDEDFGDASAQPGVWRYARASRVRVIIDGAEYFDLVQQAMLMAHQRILLIGWDFDTRIHLTRGRRWYQKGWKRQYPARLGSFILWLSRHRPGLEIRILKWSYGLLSMLARGSMVFDLIRWARHRSITFKFDNHLPLGCSHHQKIVVLDRSVAVCGGIDLTSGRWDTRDHVEHDPRRRFAGGGNYLPWHDITMMMEGPIAGALEELGRARWVRAGGKPLAPSHDTLNSAWPEGLEPHFEDVEIGIARTRAAYDGDPAVDEIAQLFVAQIAAARHFVYLESQYFASRQISEAIAQRLAEPDPPEFVIVHAAGAVGWIESMAMDPARAELVRALEELDGNDHFNAYVPYNGDTPIYVHAKLTIVDDCILRVGSANLNNRSLGLDSECDVFIDCARPGNGHAADAIARLRWSLLAEHCGIDAAQVPEIIAREGSMAGMIAFVGAGNSRQLRPYHPPPHDELTADLAAREVFDPEKPEDLFAVCDRGRGLFHSGSLLASARAMVRRKLTRKTQAPDE